MPLRSKTLIVTGPTATGKTRLAVAVARNFNGEIISADSRQVYRGLDLGTGKDMQEYGRGSDRIPTHLIDVAEPGEEFHLQKFLELAHEALAGIRGRNHLPIIAGGTPLYVDAMIKGYDLPGGPSDPRRRRRLEQLTDRQLLALLRKHASPRLLERADTSQRKRLVRAVEIALQPEPDKPPFPPLEDCLIIAPFFQRKTVRERILLRLDARFRQGMADEVQRLHDRGVSWERLDWFGLEYRHIARYLQGNLTFDEMHDELLHHIRRFAKSQDVWFRKLEREGHPIHWLPDGNTQQALQLVSDWLQDKPLPQPEIVLDTIRYNPKAKAHPM